MKAEFINPFLAAARNVIETMANTPAKASKPYLKDGISTYGKVTGIIGMVSETMTGSMIVSFETDCILAIVAKMLMEEKKLDVDRDVVDAVGEITNMICGGAKVELSKLDHKFDMATPTMIVGEGLQISCYSGSPTIVIPFETEAGTFVVEANFTEKGVKRHTV